MVSPGRFIASVVFGLALIVSLAGPSFGADVEGSDVSSGPADSEDTVDYVPRGPITISGDAGFTPANGVVGGSGTESDPYVIANWSIDASSSPAISISDTRAHFIVESVFLYNGGGANNGIQVYNVANGSFIDVIALDCYSGLSAFLSFDLIVESGEFDDCSFAGIGLMASHAVSAANNSCERNLMGFYVASCSDIEIADNLVDGGQVGIDFEMDVADSRIVRNTVVGSFTGILLGDSESCEASDNYVVDCLGAWAAIYARYSEACTISGNWIGINQSNGILALFCGNTSVVGNELTDTTNMAILAVSSPYSSVLNNTVNGATGGVIIEDSDDSVVAGNRIVGSPGSFWAGVEIHDSDRATIMANRVESFAYGIKTENPCTSGSVVLNNLSMNDIGIDLMTTQDYVLFSNIFYSNAVQGRDSSPSNRWNETYPIGGNYWSDYGGVDLMSGPGQDLPGSDGIGDTPYSVDFNTTDVYPLMEPPTYLDTEPPVTSHDYDGLWRVADFTVSLSATDNGSGVDETYYRINSGLVMSVGTGGQPLITSEGANNTLEFWSVDVAGNEELPHNLLTGVRLDKTAPTGTVTIAGGAFSNSSLLELQLDASDATSGVAEMRFSGNGTFWSAWENYSTSKYWDAGPGEGLVTVHCMVRDAALLVSEDLTDSVTVDLTGPIADAGPDITADEDTLVALDGSASSDIVGILSYEWTVLLPTPIQLPGAVVQTEFSEPGTFEAVLEVTDNVGRQDSDSVTVTVLDVTPPVADAGPDLVVDEDALASFDGSGSADNVGVDSFTWTFVDGVLVTLTGQGPTRSFAAPGVYQVTLNVSDAAGNWDLDLMYVTVLDITSPTADAGPDLSMDEDTAVPLNASLSTDNAGISVYTWTFVDSGPRTLHGMTASHVFTTPGTYVVTLNVTDAAGLWDTDTTTVTVLDVTSPIASFTGPSTVEVGEDASFDADWSGDNVGIVSYDWEFGDGEEGSGAAVSHTYDTSGVYFVNLTVTDAAGNSDTESIALTVEEGARAGSEWVWAGIALAAIVVAIIAILLIMRRTSKGRAPPG